MRAQLDQVARASWIAGTLLVASTLLAGCNQTSTASSPSAQGSATAQGSSGAPPSGSGTPTSAQKSADVSWTAPTSNTNGSALTDLAGYRIYYGTGPGKLDASIDVPNAGASDYVVTGLTSGTWYFAVAAYTNVGVESTLSSVVSKTIAD